MGIFAIHHAFQEFLTTSTLTPHIRYVMRIVPVPFLLLRRTIPALLFVLLGIITFKQQLRHWHAIPHAPITILLTAPTAILISAFQIATHNRQRFLLLLQVHNACRLVILIIIHYREVSYNAFQLAHHQMFMESKVCMILL